MCYWKMILGDTCFQKMMPIKGQCRNPFGEQSLMRAVGGGLFVSELPTYLKSDCTASLRQPPMRMPLHFLASF